MVTECPRRRLISILKALNVLSSAKYFLELTAFIRQPARNQTKIPRMRIALAQRRLPIGYHNLAYFGSVSTLRRRKQVYLRTKSSAVGSKSFFINIYIEAILNLSSVDPYPYSEVGCFALLLVSYAGLGSVLLFPQYQR